MGFRFRKSIKIGKGFRINLSKSGIGWSMGTKAFRYTKKARGGSRTTASIPGTGISYSKDYGSKSKSKKRTKASNRQSNNSIWNVYRQPHDLFWWVFVGWWLWAILFYAWIFYLIFRCFANKKSNSSSNVNNNDISTGYDNE